MFIDSPSVIHGPGIEVFMIFGFIDFEATGTDPQTAHIIEWALVRYSSEQKQILTMHTELVRLPDGVVLPPEITELTGITESMLVNYGWGSTETLYKQAYFCDFLVAHNGTSYDKPLYTAHAKRWNIQDITTPWIDTMTDIPYPAKIKARGLITLCAEHGFLNPLAHRAMSDCISLWKLFTQYDENEIVAIASTPMITLRADVTYARKDLAKEAGYRWDGEAKIWVKQIREYYLKKERERPFNVLILPQ